MAEKYHTFWYRLFVDEIKIKDEETTQKPGTNVIPSVKVLSTFKSMWVTHCILIQIVLGSNTEFKGGYFAYIFRYIGNKCSNVLTNGEEMCKKLSSKSDFVKLSVFATFLWNWSPLDVMARACNSRAEDALTVCQQGLDKDKKVVNFVMTDFPNFPGPGGKTIVEIAEQINTQRAEMFRTISSKRNC